MKTSKRQNFILLPSSGSEITLKSNPQVADFLTTLDDAIDFHSGGSSAMSFSVRNMPQAPQEEIAIEVIDSIKSKGAKLVSLDTNEMANFRFSYPGLRIIPEKFYSRTDAMQERLDQKITAKTASKTLDVFITDQAATPLLGITVIAFTDFKLRIGSKARTNAKGYAKLRLNADKIERLYIYPDHSYWGVLQKNIKTKQSLEIKLVPLDLGTNDSLRHFFDTRNFQQIENPVKVGVIDTGAGPHNNLLVAGGKNMINGEDPDDYSDKESHGTHVAGIIGASGVMPGVALGADLHIYRVFAVGKNASNFDIMKAIAQAIADKCDLINMSLGEKDLDEGLISSIKDAYNAGIVCFAANGNDGRQPVSFPAAYSLSIAVGAMGRKGTYPASSTQADAEAAPYGTSPDNYVAAFSNIGPETDLIAPGVAIISTYPGDYYAAMDGTSMACPAATGLAARLLSTRADLLALPRNQVRSDEILKFLSQNIQAMGFGANFEGKGMFHLP